MAKQPPAPAPAPGPILHHLINLDKNLSYFLHKVFHPYLPTSLLLLLELSADFRFSFPLTAAVTLSPLSPPLLPFLSPLLLGLLLDLAVVGLVKIIFRRPRPPYNPNMSPVVSADNFSFPSGHASRVFFVAALVLLSAGTIEKAMAEFGRGGGGYVVAVVAVWAAVTATSRVLLGRHFVVDVLAGACLGALEGIFAFWFLRFENYFSMLLYQKADQGRSQVL